MDFIGFMEFFLFETLVILYTSENTRFIVNKFKKIYVYLNRLLYDKNISGAINANAEAKEFGFVLQQSCHSGYGHNSKFDASSIFRSFIQ